MTARPARPAAEAAPVCGTARPTSLGPDDDTGTAELEALVAAGAFYRLAPEWVPHHFDTRRPSAAIGVVPRLLRLHGLPGLPEHRQGAMPVRRRHPQRANRLVNTISPSTHRTARGIGVTTRSISDTATCVATLEVAAHLGSQIHP